MSTDLSEEERRLHKIQQYEEQIYRRVDVSHSMADDELQNLIGTVLTESAPRNGLSIQDRLQYQRELFHSIRGLDLISELLEDESVTEIMINGANHVFVEREGKLLPCGRSFSSQEKLLTVIQQIVAQVNRRVNESSPIADARLKDGSRVNIVLPPVSLVGPVITIRKFPAQPLTMDDLIQKGTLSRRTADFLEQMVINKKNIFISGGTGTGKTTFLNILSGYIPPEERVITIEDSAELQLQNLDNLVRLEARNSNLEGSNEITIRDLIRSALRMRPDRIVVGEVRGAEAVDMLQAMNTGHAGSLSTGHANSSMDMLYRLEMMVLMGMDIPIQAVRRQIASAIDLVVHLGRNKDGHRQVFSIERLVSLNDGEYIMESCFSDKKRRD